MKGTVSATSLPPDAAVGEGVGEAAAVAPSGGSGAFGAIVGDSPGAAEAVATGDGLGAIAAMVGAVAVSILVK